MKLNPSKSSISVISGILTLIIFCIFTFTSVVLFPIHYTPIINWLSDLGNSSYNPAGFIFFNVGCIITGILLIIFFTGLCQWYDKVENKKLLIIAQIIGIFSAFALIMVGIFSEDYGALHWLWSALFFLSLLFVLIFLNVALFISSKFKRWVSYYGFGAVFMDFFFIMLYFIPNNFPKPLFEWLTVFISLGWLGLLVYNMTKF